MPRATRLPLYRQSRIFARDGVELDRSTLAGWAHVRRKFFDVHAARGPAIAAEALERIAALYAIEKEARGRPPGRRAAIRRAKAAPCLDELERWLQSQLPRISAKTPLAAAVVIGFAWLLESLWTWMRPYPGYPVAEPGYPGTALDRAVRAQSYIKITYLLPRYLPSDLEGAIKRLREFGFGEGCRLVGVSYRRSTAPGQKEVNERDRRRIRRYNEILRDHDAVSLRRFWRRMPSRGGRGDWVHIYLLTKEDGSMKTIGWVPASKF